MNLTENKKTEEQHMADFIQKTVTKTAVRELISPVEDVDAFNGIVQSVISNNPFSCVPYMQAGVSHNPVEKTREGYVARLVYEDTLGKQIGYITIGCPSIAAFNSIATRILAEPLNATDMGGSGFRDIENEGFTATLKCHDPNGELYNVVFGREAVRLNSYSDDTIRTTVETWADGVPALA
jgi:hypothetical protein